MRLSEGRFLAAAAVLHLAVPVAAAIAPGVPSRPLAGKSAPLAAEIDVDVALDRSDRTSDPRDERRRVGEGSAAPHEAQDDARVSRRAAPREPTEPDEPPIFEGPPDSETEFNAEPAPNPDGDPMAKPPSLGDVGGLGGFGNPLWPGALPPPDSGPRDPAPTETKKRQYDEEQARRAIDSGIRKKDADLGLDFPAANAIGAVLRDAVRAADTPDECTASFSVTVNAQGRVTDVAAVASSGGASSAWQSVQQSAKAALKGRSFEMKSSFAKGAVVSVRVRSAMKMPGGGTSRSGASLSFDVTDIGARPIRVVTMSSSAKPID